jgi:hypothetical protein
MLRRSPQQQTSPTTPPKFMPIRAEPYNAGQLADVSGLERYRVPDTARPAIGGNINGEQDSGIPFNRSIGGRRK